MLGDPRKVKKGPAVRYTIISDIHSNLEALQAVLADIEKLPVDQILCLGDVVGYGPNPNECIELVKATSSVVLAGNHDWAPVGKMDTAYFNPYARSAVEWTAGELTRVSADFLRHLPLTDQRDGAFLVHATPDDPAEWDYITSVWVAQKNFSYFGDQVCFIGHSHVPVTWIKNEMGNFCRAERSPSVEFSAGQRYIINVGSVGQPRDLDPKASYGIFDSEEKTFELRRVEYNIAETQRKIRQAGLPEYLAERLGRGE